MTCRFLPSLALSFGMSMLASCSIFHADEDMNKDADKEKKKETPVITEIAPLPGGDPIMSVSTSVDPMLPMTRPFIREPDVTTNLPLNLDGTTAKADKDVNADDAGIPAPAPEASALIPPVPTEATAPLVPATAPASAPATDTATPIK